MREHHVADYLAGQVTYNLGDYPKPFSITPTDYDRQLLQTLGDHGVGLIQLHEEWNDSQRVLRADKYTSHDPEGLRAFIALAHGLGIRVILYASTGFFEATDPEFDPSWAHPDQHLVELYFDYARCSPAGPEWRAYLLPRLERILDDYGVDGLYNDCGYPRLYRQPPMPGHISPGSETEHSHAAFHDLARLVADLVHSRKGVYKVHVGNVETCGLTNDVYDYLWVGEGLGDLDELREKTKGHPPYVVPCIDQSHGRLENEDDLFLHSVPFMQFPLRVDGRPLTGERGLVEGLDYRRGDRCWWTRHMKRINQHFREHPDGPHSYGWWDSCPGRANAREVWLRHLDLYLPMVTSGSRVWIDIGDNTLFDPPLPAEMTASLFVNHETYLVLANYAHKPATVTSSWLWQDRTTGAADRNITVPARSLVYLVRRR